MADAPPASPPKKTLADLIAIMAALRTPVTGCPWDLEQTFKSIAPYTIEEAYEVADAIERDDLGDLEEELGDLLLQVVYHARLAEEIGAFAFADVANGIAIKMIRRHPHVFGDETARSAGMAKGAWERIKAIEKAEKAARRRALSGAASPLAVSAAPEPSPASLLADVPRGQPAFTRAIKLQEKAARVGFDWPSIAPVLAKVREELGELEDVLSGLPTPDAQQPSAGIDKAHLEEEFGDLLFVLANLARHLAIDPEAALRGANAKFTRRFGYIERKLAADGRSAAQSDLAEMDALWNDAKAAEKKP